MLANKQLLFCLQLFEYVIINVLDPLADVVAGPAIFAIAYMSSYS
jgi:hypothetical protein